MLKTNTKKLEIMKKWNNTTARASQSEPSKILVTTIHILKGRGTKFVGKNSKGLNKFLLTQLAFDKIAKVVEWEN